jgi:hypothetical protein
LSIMIKAMNAKLNLSLLASIVAFALPAFAQIDGPGFANNLRAKYGPPLARETFIVRPNFEMVVEYAANGHVCRIQLPPVAPGPEPGVKTTQAVDDFLGELVPLTMRGKELMSTVEAVGAPSFSTVRYENVTITESMQDLRRTKVTVTFRNEECRTQTPL